MTAWLLWHCYCAGLSSIRVCSRGLPALGDRVRRASLSESYQHDDHAGRTGNAGRPGTEAVKRDLVIKLTEPVELMVQ